MKKIGLVLSTTPAYSETFFNSKIKGLQEQGFQVMLFVQHKKNDFYLCPVFVAPKVYKNVLTQTLAMGFVFLKLIFHFKTLLRFIQLEKQQKIPLRDILKKIYLNAHILKQKLDWLHFGFATQAIGSAFVAKAIQAKMAISFRGFDINVYPLKYPDGYTLAFMQVDKVHSISNYLLKKAYTLGLKQNTPYQIITPAVQVNKFKPFVLAQVGGTIQIVTIARLNWIKGLETSIQAMQFLKAKNINFQYHIIGSGNASEVEKYAFQVHELNLKAHVFFRGSLSHQETIDVLSTANIYVQPSLNEGFSNAVLEAQALGKLCIVSAVGGLPENIIDKETGWLVPVGNPKKLAQKIIEVIHLPDEKKQQVSRQARSRVEQHFTLKQQQKAFEIFYKENEIVPI